MGWIYYRPPGETKQAQLKYLVANETKSTHNSEYSSTTLKHTLRGKVLWKVVSLRRHEDGEEFRYIECILLDYLKDTRQWGCKPMDEGMGPSYYSCPLGYLKLAPENMLPEGIAGSEFSRSWREQVRMYHRKHQVGDRLILSSGYKIPELLVIQLKPLVGVYRGTRFKVPREGVVKVIPAGENQQVA